MAKTVLFGGSFDPPHLGHLEMAKAALRHPEAGRVLLLPSWQAPHKHEHAASDAQRLAMCTLLAEGYASIGLLPVEIEHQFSYTADTLRFLRKQTPDVEFCLLMGSDAARSLRWWADAEYILNTTDLLVVSRAGDPDRADLGQMLDAAIPPVSSTGIRRCRALGESIHGLTTEAVEAYILSHRLYEEG